MASGWRIGAVELAIMAVNVRAKHLRAGRACGGGIVKRSELNRIIADALALCAERNFLLPPFAYWSLDDWKVQAPHHQEILDNQMGWDITDFGSGDFAKVGIRIFLARNGNFFNPTYRKPYCEKVLIQEEGQLSPFTSTGRRSRTSSTGAAAI